MADPDVILTARVMPARRNASAGDVARFVRYVQYRDIHPDSREARDVDDLIAYVHHRDPTSPRGRMFDAAGPAGDEQRQALVDLIGRSNQELMGREHPSSTSLRAAYRLIISPADASGIDLKRLTRAAMARLEASAGGKLPPWIAGEHRNTLHPHVHVVLAARRETEPGQFRTLVITRDRLAAMKEALHEEMAFQREAHMNLRGAALRAGEAEIKSRLHPEFSPSQSEGSAGTAVEARRANVLAWSPGRRSRGGPLPPMFEVAAIAGRLSHHHRREAERLARERRHEHLPEEDDRRARYR
jgi:hypothetical protein